MANTSNYPGGFSSGVTIQNVPVSIPHPGKVFWVNNSSVLAPGGIGGSNSNDGTFQRPFSTLDYAIGRCVADRGDVIYVMPGYLQDMAAADAVDADVAGITIIGLGRGTKVPEFNYSNAAGEFVIGAANVHIENLRFVPSVTGITVGIDIEAAAHYYEVVNCRFTDGDTAGTDEFTNGINVNGADFGLFVNNFMDSGEAAAAVGISLIGACDGTIFKNNTIIGDYSTANINGITTLSNDVGFEFNVLINGVTSALNTTPVIDMLTGTSGWVAGNRMATDIATSLDLMVDLDAGVNLSNYFTDDVAMTKTAVDRSAAMTVSADA